MISPDDESAVRRTAANLYRLLSHLGSHIQNREASFYYAAEAVEYMRAILDSIHATLRYLRKKQRPSDSASIEDLRDTLVLLSEQWRTVHNFVKPVTDAHLLRVPVPLVELLNRQASALPGLQGSKIVLLHGHQLGYFKREHTSIKDALDAIGVKIAAAGVTSPGFPAQLGLIVLPYSSTRQLFQNTLLYHELGEYVYDEKKVAQEIRDKIDQDVQSVPSGEDEVVGGALTDADKEQLISYCRELFCDLFAVRLVGPVFSFAFAEYIDLVNDWQVDYGKRHPPDDIRLGEQIELLKHLHWWERLSKRYGDLCACFEGLHARQKKKRKDWEEYIHQGSQNRDGEPGSDERTLRALTPLFDCLRPFVRELARVHTDDAGHPQCDLDECWERISDCLAHGIVPSAILLADEDQILSPITVVNAAYFFERKELDRVFPIISGRSKSRVADRAWLQSRVEEWTLKAVDDILEWVDEKRKRT